MVPLIASMSSLLVLVLVRVRVRMLALQLVLVQVQVLVRVRVRVLVQVLVQVLVLVLAVVLVLMLVLVLVLAVVLVLMRAKDVAKTVLVHGVEAPVPFLAVTVPLRPTFQVTPMSAALWLSTALHPPPPSPKMVRWARRTA